MTNVTGMALQGTLNVLAGTTGLAADEAARRLLDLQIFQTGADGETLSMVDGAAAWASVLPADQVANVVPKATVGNLLTANQASVETDTTGFFARENISSMAASSSASLYGSKSLAVTSTGSADTLIQLGSGLYTYDRPVTAGLTYTFLVHVKSAATARDAVAFIIWRDGGGGGITTTTGVTVTTTTSGWTRVSVTGVAPAGTAEAQIVVTIRSSVANEVHYFDCFSFHQGAGGLWALPGTPVTNLGFYTDESVGRRLFQWDANNSRWQMTFGDTGWRDVSAGLESGTTGEWRMRRVNSTVTHHVYNVTNSSGVMYTIPAGFRTASYGTVIPLTKWDLTAGAVLLNSPAIGNCTLSDGLKGYTGAYYMFTHDTSEAWPTSLPGSAVGSIPA